MPPKHPNNQDGSIILYALLMMGSILLISLTLAAIFIPKIHSAANASSSISAIYAADSAIEWCLYINAGNPTVAMPTMSNGATYTLTPSSCAPGPLNNQAIGTYQGVSRSLQVQE